MAHSCIQSRPSCCTTRCLLICSQPAVLRHCCSFDLRHCCHLVAIGLLLRVGATFQGYAPCNRLSHRNLPGITAPTPTPRHCSCPFEHQLFERLSPMSAVSLMSLMFSCLLSRFAEPSSRSLPFAATQKLLLSHRCHPKTASEPSLPPTNCF